MSERPLAKFKKTTTSKHEWGMEEKPILRDRTED